MTKTKGTISCRFKIEPFEHDFMNFCKEIGFVVEDVNHELYAKDVGELRLILSGTYYWAFIINIKLMQEYCVKFVQKGGKNTSLYDFLHVTGSESIIRNIIQNTYQEPKKKIKPKPIVR